MTKIHDIDGRVGKMLKKMMFFSDRASDAEMEEELAGEVSYHFF